MLRHQTTVCLSTHDYDHRHPRFSTISLGSRRHRTRSRASFNGGCSIPVFGPGRQKLRRPSRNSWSKVFSKKSDLLIAECFTAFRRVIFPRSSNDEAHPLRLTQFLESPNEKGKLCPLH